MTQQKFDLNYNWVSNQSKLDFNQHKQIRISVSKQGTWAQNLDDHSAEASPAGTLKESSWGVFPEVVKMIRVFWPPISPTALRSTHGSPKEFPVASLDHLNIYIYILGKFNISLTWIKAIRGWFPLFTMIIVRSQWGRYNLPMPIYILCIRILQSGHKIWPCAMAQEKPP